MINSKLQKICEAVDEWCVKNNIPYDIVADETDLQGVMIFKRNRNKLLGLIDHISPMVGHEDIHMEMIKVRGGNILSFSLQAISESDITKILSDAGEEREPMNFKERVAAAAVSVVAETEEPETLETKLFQSAKKIVESQRKSATGGMTRANQTSRNRQALTSDVTVGGVEHGASPRAIDLGKKTKSQSSKGTKKGVSKGPETRFENKICLTLGLKPTSTQSNFDNQLFEALDGMATATGAQPGDLFAKFARALQVLGQQMGIGPLQDKLKEQGINWKKSDDGLAIILYVKNATTGSPQPIARITSETLEKPNDFEDQLKNMLDFAKGEAPGTLTQKQNELKDQERAIRDIAQAISPQDQESAVAQQMNTGMQTDPQAAAPVDPQAQAAPQAAAQAVAPKPTAELQQKPVLSAGKMRRRSGLL